MYWCSSKEAATALYNQVTKILQSKNNNDTTTKCFKTHILLNQHGDDKILYDVQERETWFFSVSAAAWFAERPGLMVDFSFSRTERPSFFSGWLEVKGFTGWGLQSQEFSNGMFTQSCTLCSVVKRSFHTLDHTQHIEKHPNPQNAVYNKLIILMARGDGFKLRENKSECFDRILNNSSFIWGHGLTLQGRSIPEISRTHFLRSFLKCYNTFSHKASEPISALAGRKRQVQWPGLTCCTSNK